MGKTSNKLPQHKNRTWVILCGAVLLFSFSTLSLAQTGNNGVTTDTSGTLNDKRQCSEGCDNCCSCHTPIINDHTKIRTHITNELERHRNWLVADYFIGNGPDAGAEQYGILPAMMLMTEQLTAAGIAQVQAVGQFLDAKHQLETQRLFQQLTAKAHKDYHPSEGLCEMGTNVRSLLPSQRRADLMQTAFSERTMARGLLTGKNLSVGGSVTDIRSRLKRFMGTYCNPDDNAEGLKDLCGSGAADKKRINKDVDFTRTLETPLTIDMDFTQGANTDDSEDVGALTDNIFAHEVPPLIPRHILANDKGQINREAGYKYLGVRALAAKRSVAQSSFAAITAMKSSGSPESAPFLKKWVEEMGVPADEVEQYVGKQPSYFAQMEMLTKKIYQNPTFYADLYDKPVNVERKAAALEAVGLMQDRDIYRSLLRSEMVLAVFLDTLLTQEQDKVANKINQMTGGGEKSTSGGAAP